MNCYFFPRLQPRTQSILKALMIHAVSSLEDLKCRWATDKNCKKLKPLIRSEVFRRIINFNNVFTFYTLISNTVAIHGCTERQYFSHTNLVILRKIFLFTQVFKSLQIYFRPRSRIQRMGARSFT